MPTLMQDDSESPTITPSPRKRKQLDMSKEDVLQKILQELSEMKTVIRRLEKLCFEYGISIALLDSLGESLECCICKTSPSNPPIIVCKECKTLVGCNDCTKEKYSGRDGMDKPCPKCRASRSFSSSMELKGFDGLVDVIKSAQAVAEGNVEEHERENESNATTAPLNFNE